MYMIFYTDFVFAQLNYIASNVRAREELCLTNERLEISLIIYKISDGCKRAVFYCIQHCRMQHIVTTDIISFHAMKRAYRLDKYVEQMHSVI